MASQGHLRASDSDRDHIADRLRHATAEGRLSTLELEHRLSAAFSARTYGELERLVRDLPGKRAANRARSIAVTAAAIAVAIVAVMAVAAIVVLVLTGIAMWFGWILLAWWFFGHRRRRLRRQWSGWELRPVNRRGAL
ncbi:MAG: DUF1707 domain-containing protein [Solirubrobacterales bacterium]|nr:DUF1707 domain-containing protein [Solirubrobacterales bacterium]